MNGGFLVRLGPVGQKFRKFWGAIILPQMIPSLGPGVRAKKTPIIREVVLAPWGGVFIYFQREVPPPPPVVPGGAAVNVTVMFATLKQEVHFPFLKSVAFTIFWREKKSPAIPRKMDPHTGFTTCPMTYDLEMVNNARLKRLRPRCFLQRSALKTTRCSTRWRSALASVPWSAGSTPCLQENENVEWSRIKDPLLCPKKINFLKERWRTSVFQGFSGHSTELKPELRCSFAVQPPKKKLGFEFWFWVENWKSAKKWLNFDYFEKKIWQLTDNPNVSHRLWKSLLWFWVAQ